MMIAPVTSLQESNLQYITSLFTPENICYGYAQFFFGQVVILSLSELFSFYEWCVLLFVIICILKLIAIYNLFIWIVC